MKECVQSWGFLKNYYIFENEVPSDPFEFTNPETLYNRMSDPWTQYISPDFAEYFLSFFTTENASGLGIFIRARFDSVYIIRHVIRNSPAENAGLKKGDTLLTINGTRATGLSLESLHSLLAGPAGSPVSLEVLRADGIHPYTVIRGPFVAPTVFADTMADSIPYIALLEFFDSAAPGINGTWKELASALAQTAPFAARPTILDLRGNPGGLIDQCMKCCSLLLPAGSVIIRARCKDVDSVTGEAGIRDSVYTVAGNSSFASRPLLVLVDSNSASASEIMTAALQENRPGVFIAGQHTFGKARGQILGPTLSGGIVKITSMTFTTKNGADYNGTGLAPDSALGNDVDWLDYAWLRAHDGLPPGKASLAAQSGRFSTSREIELNRRLLGLKGRERFRIGKLVTP